MTELVNVHLKYLTHQLGSCKPNYSVISGALPAFVELGNRVLYEGAQEVCVERCVVLEAEYVGAMTTAPLLLSCMFTIEMCYRNFHYRTATLRGIKFATSRVVSGRYIVVLQKKGL